MTNLDELNALLEERARYEKWIAQLNAKREQTPPHVFDRVRGDYASRLEAVHANRDVDLQSGPGLQKNSPVVIRQTAVIRGLDLLDSIRQGRFAGSAKALAFEVVDAAGPVGRFDAGFAQLLNGGPGRLPVTGGEQGAGPLVGPAAARSLADHPPQPDGARADDQRRRDPRRQHDFGRHRQRLIELSERHDHATEFPRRRIEVG